eukprot:CAMPEP_0197636304 /NCGR_PEP_ID=MMETSP1338-20131121/11853_1 /TAXON_ID=43686 ORGANISM="Pelagodinium beii, Strain RCC1491" /NCGR_SAMPLE_ID=MMETSP1338 /ASSEMBLY_ACC=CAM_ASM_000754 /LENGTH=65 /DNA_ID=CAMNT_0043208513 /DNA_START=77 /DNA_END=270 /DNA_ORIENTATION=+
MRPQASGQLQMQGAVAVANPDSSRRVQQMPAARPMQPQVPAGVATVPSLAAQLGQGHAPPPPPGT